MPNRITFALLVPALLFGADVPAGFPQPAIPTDNPITAAKVELGRYLFYDKRLSANGKQACSSCHKQELAFTDGRARSQGSTGEMHPRGSMSLVNIAYAPSLTWSNTALTSLEEQALTPMLGDHPVELGLKGHETELLQNIRRDPTYQRLFPAAFEEISLPNVTKAIAVFERTIISVRSPYDRYRWQDEPNAISAAAKRGEIIFSSGERGGCFQCHGGWNFSAVRFEGGHERSILFNTGVSDDGQFRAPTLRNIALTAPYMHDGSMKTLEEVIDHYAAGGKVKAANKSKILHTFSLTANDKQDLIEFLKSLTDQEMIHDPRWSDPWPH